MQIKKNLLRSFFLILRKGQYKVQKEEASKSRFQMRTQNIILFFDIMSFFALYVLLTLSPLSSCFYRMLHFIFILLCWLLTCEHSNNL